LRRSVRWEDKGGESNSSRSAGTRKIRWRTVDDAGGHEAIIREIERGGKAYECRSIEARDCMPRRGQTWGVLYTARDRGNKYTTWRGGAKRNVKELNESTLPATGRIAS
jgi:hypothetical protein